MTNEIEELKGKGLTPSEAELLSKWMAEGKPGLAKHRAEALGELYIHGYSCKEIHRWFPQFPYEIILWSRLYYKWDDLKKQHIEAIQNETIESALITRMESIRFLSDVMRATHVKWRRQLIDYITDPEHHKPPECLPKNIYSYGQLLNTHEALLNPGRANRNDGDDPLGNMKSPLVSITVKNENGKPDVIIQPATQEEVKQALMDDVKKKKHGNGP